MKYETILVPVKCSPETNPKVGGSYYTNYYADARTLYDPEEGWFVLVKDLSGETVFKNMPVFPTIWYEPQHDKIVLSEEELALMLNDSFPETIEEATAYLISEGLDPDQIAKDGLKFIEELKKKIGGSQC